MTYFFLNDIILFDALGSMDPLQRAMRGCCGGDVPINFNLLTMPQTFDVNVNSFWFWGSAVLIIAEPFFKPAVGIMVLKYKSAVKGLVGNTNAFFIYCVLSYALSFGMIFCFMKTMNNQPFNYRLAENSILFLGYSFLIGGFTLKAYVYNKYGLKRILGAGQYFDLPITDDAEVTIYDPYYHPCATATLACLLGASLIHASLAGLFLYALSAVFYHAAFFLERHFENKRK